MRTYKKCGGTENTERKIGRNETCFNEKPTGPTMVQERRMEKEEWKEKLGRASLWI